MADSIIVPRIYNCYNCGNLICRHDDIISKHFQAGQNRAFLFSHVENVLYGPAEDRHLITGLHTVTMVYCLDCGEKLGWRYIKAYDALQKYKEGKVVVEKVKIVVAED